MRPTVSVLSVCLALGAVDAPATAGDAASSSRVDPKLEVTVSADKTGNVPSGSLSLQAISRLPKGSSPVAAQVTIQSSADKLAKPTIVGNFVLFGEGASDQGFTFDLNKRVDEGLLSDIRKGNAVVTVTVKPIDSSTVSKDVLELKSATFEQ